MANKWITVSGIVIQGHRVASAPSEIYPYGSLVKQIPYFKILGLDLTGHHPGTINISIIPKSWRMVEADYTFQNVAWTNLHPPEDFSFSTSRINFNDQKYHGWIYYPHPDTKARHFQDRSVIEVITVFIPKIGYGSEVSLELKAKNITLEE